MTKAKQTIFLLMLAAVAVALGPSICAAQQEDTSPLQKLTDHTAGFFSPLEGTVASVVGNTITSDITEEMGIRAGMRLKVLRKGEPFLHPLTKEPIGETEIPVGEADVTATETGGSTLSVLNGDVREGDILRLSAVNVRALFYQTGEVDWDLSEEYYRTLEATGRFELLNSDFVSDETPELIKEAEKLGARVLISLTQKKDADKTVLIQRLYRTADSRMFSETLTPLDSAFISSLKLGERLLGPIKEDIYVAFRILFNARLMGVGDINGDREPEIVMSAGGELKFFSYGSSLKPALGEETLKITRQAEHLWLDLGDLDGDGSDEIVLTLKNEDTIESYVYKYGEEGFSTVWTGNFFVRLIGDELYGQKYALGEGFRGEVFPIVMGGTDKRDPRKLKSLKLPPGVNIYDFTFIKGKDGKRLIVAYDRENHMNIYNADGLSLWRSEGNAGGPLLMFKRDESSIEQMADFWVVNDRIVLKGAEALFIKRKPLLKNAKSMGYKSSTIKALVWNGASAVQSALIGKIDGKLIDYQIYDEKLFVLSSPLFGFDAKKILSGENPFINRLFIYPLKVK